jgi:hypothetical protein
MAGFMTMPQANPQRDRLHRVPLRLDRSIPFVSAVFDYVEGRAGVDQPVSILVEAENRCGLRFAPFDDQVREFNGADEHWRESVLFPFLSATHFVLAGGDFLNLCVILDAAGREVPFTWRYWGEVLAEWANRDWFLRPSGLGEVEAYRAARPWMYLDFYMSTHVEGVVANYTKWASAIDEILTHKTRL